MENKKVLFITYDLSGYYTGVYEELCRQYKEVDFYNLEDYNYKYKDFYQRIYGFFCKTFTGENIKSHYKYQGIVNEISAKQYDMALIIRPDLFTIPQLKSIKKSCRYMISYYHDSINHIRRKKKVIRFFDKVYSYEKRDVERYNLNFISNFIYWEGKFENQPCEFEAFNVMSYDYRFSTLKKVAESLKNMGITFRFNVVTSKKVQDNLIHIDNKRITNKEVLDGISRSNVILDIHKYGVQDGLTFRVFEAIGFKKKLITTNKDIKNYDFYNPNNIFVIEDVKSISIPRAFFDSLYEDIPAEIYERYTVKSWIETIFNI